MPNHSTIDQKPVRVLVYCSAITARSAHFVSRDASIPCAPLDNASRGDQVEFPRGWQI